MFLSNLYVRILRVPVSKAVMLSPGDTLEDCLGRGEVRACLLPSCRCGGVVRASPQGHPPTATSTREPCWRTTSKAGEVRAHFLLDFGLAKMGDGPPSSRSLTSWTWWATALEMIPDTDHLTEPQLEASHHLLPGRGSRLLHEALDLSPASGLRQTQDKDQTF
ncbi:hypothetical protein GWK47_024130 [Chionoecetes opilio]|uniref:Uncharacterized protein n=1 Tax=Chionoecetes opilio TaxID=41210 RepID=A0A8J4XVN6_CHIOP|nr:hypothetical protein GWK47_024130 [Chionoecetes opilio]